MTNQTGGCRGGHHATGIQIAAQWPERTMASFISEGSNDESTWTTLFSQSGLSEVKKVDLDSLEPGRYIFKINGISQKVAVQ